MRFAIALLSLIAIASVAGTILRQNEAQVNYVDQFGLFWATLFDHLSLYTVYSAWWFFLILAFLIVSTLLCLYRNTPKIFSDLRNWKDQVHEGNLRALHHHDTFQSPMDRAHLVNILPVNLANYRLRLRHQNTHSLLVGRHGSANKLGYIIAHSAIVIICLGALADSDLLIRAQLWWQNKSPLISQNPNLLINEIPPSHRLSAANPSFRANLFVAEGQNTNAALLNLRDGLLLQDLPFSLALKKFTVDYYSTGMPKLFSSEVVLTDHQTGKQIPTTIQVNHPFSYRGITIYQSGFEDGGSHLNLLSYPMRGKTYSPDRVSGQVGNHQSLKSGENNYTLEFTNFRAINVDTFNSTTQDTRDIKSGNAVLKRFEAHLGSGAKTNTSKTLRNIGPSVQYKLRDTAGQAAEFDNYMLPVLLDKTPVFLIGMRTTPSEAFRYLRIPADEQGSINEWMVLRAALQDDKTRLAAAQRYSKAFFAQTKERNFDSATALPSPDQLQASTLRILELFAGTEPSMRDEQGNPLGGYSAIAAMINQTVPTHAQSHTAEILAQLVQGSLFELWQVTRAQRHLPAASHHNTSELAFIQTAINALSDSFFYKAPIVLQLTDFNEIKASVFQLSRTPGKYVVYFGCLLLVVGVFTMFYIRERRLWVLIKDGTNGYSDILVAYSTHRKTMDFEQEFMQLCTRLRSVTQAKSITNHSETDAVTVIAPTPSSRAP